MNRFISIFIVLLNGFVLVAQKNKDNFNMFLLSFDYSSNTNTYGVTESEIKNPNYSSTISFFSKRNFDISYSAVVTDNADSTYSEATLEHDISAGYNFDIGKYFSIYPSYTQIFQSKNSYALKSLFSNIIQTDFSFSPKNYNNYLTISYLSGKKGMFYIAFQNSLVLEKENLIFKNTLLNAQMGFSVNFSDINYYNKFIYDSWGRIELFAWLKENYPLLAKTAIAYSLNNNLESTKEMAYERLLKLDPSLFSANYKLTSIDFLLPINYSINNFMLYVTGYVSIPVANTDFLQVDNTFFISTGISYAFMLK